MDFPDFAVPSLAFYRMSLRRSPVDGRESRLGDVDGHPPIVAQFFSCLLRAPHNAYPIYRTSSPILLIWPLGRAC